MTTQVRYILGVLLVILGLNLSTLSLAESQSFKSDRIDPEENILQEKQDSESEDSNRGVRLEPKKRKYFTDDSPRTDAGVFHVGFAGGGNFYIEPKVNANQTPNGEFFRDFGFQAGVYFDYDYSELDENIPLALRGMIGYKYILNSVHVFTFDGVVRRMFRFSEKASFGLGMGASAAAWYRTVTDLSPNEETIFLPTMILGAGFEFNPFMVDFKCLINRLGSDNHILGLELYFGFRL